VGHRYAARDGVPVLLADRANETITESFSHEWAQFDHERDRTWGATAEERLDDFLRHVALERDEMRNLHVLDAGCGNGALSDAITRLECDVVATDISNSVFAASAQFSENPRLTFVQSDLARSAFVPQSFDLIYCAGVLHHTPSTYGTLLELLKALRPGGRIFIWLYWRVPGISYKAKAALRRAVAPLPLWAKHALVVPVTAQAHVRHRDEELSWHERMVIQLDYFTPRYRWEHTPDEVERWFRKAALSEIRLTEEGRDGFGMVAWSPCERTSDGVSFGHA
jgi:SAM-dependent methyltransferase